MIGVALKGLLGRKLRAILTAFAIVLGVAMISGSFVLTDTLGKGFDGIYDESYASTDAVISSKIATSTDEGGEEAPAFSANVLDRVEQLPGVRVAQGSIEDEISLTDEAGKRFGSDGVALGVAADADQSLNPIQVVTGDWPRGDGQIAIDKSTAEAQHLKVGQTVGAYGDGPVRKYEISGIVRFGSVDSIGGASISVFDLPTAQRLFDKQGRLDLIRVGAKPGVSETELTRQIRPLLSETTKVNTATVQAAEDSDETQQGMSIMKYFLLGFGGIALFVGSFVIANTLAITVAQRMRELATLRTLGASRRQVLRSVLLESLVIGLVGSVVGLFLGLGIAAGLKAVVAAAGTELPAGGLVFAPRTIIVSLAVGTLIALLASLRPAIKATRVEPIAAVREGAVLPASRFARYALPAALTVIAAAVGLFSYGVFASGPRRGRQDRLARRRRARAVRRRGDDRLPRRASAGVRARNPRCAKLGGTAGKLARQNAVRNPKRTASTAAAVMIGLALITFVAVIGQGLRTSFTGSVNELFIADYAITTADATPLTNEAADGAQEGAGRRGLGDPLLEGRGPRQGRVRHLDGRQPAEDRRAEAVGR